MYQTWSIKQLAWFHMMKNQHLSTRHLTPNLKLNLKLAFLVTGISWSRAVLKRTINADQEAGRVEWNSCKTSIDRFSNPMTFAGARNKDFETSRISCSSGYTVTDGIWYSRNGSNWEALTIWNIPRSPNGQRRRRNSSRSTAVRMLVKSLTSPEQTWTEIDVMRE